MSRYTQHREHFRKDQVIDILEKHVELPFPGLKFDRVEGLDENVWLTFMWKPEDD